MDCFDALLLALFALAGSGVLLGLWRARMRHRVLESRVARLEAQTRTLRNREAPPSESTEGPAISMGPQGSTSGAPESRVQPPMARPPREAATAAAVPGRATQEAREPESATPAAAPSPSPSAPSPSLESVVGGRVLLVAGVVVVLFGLGFFLKHAIDQAWLGPAGRIVLGVVAGIGATLGGDRLRGRGLHAYGTALMGAGLGAIYLSIYFATARYGFLGAPGGFALTALVTAIAAALALKRNAPLLAYLGFLGGLLAPALLGSGEDALGPLTGWLCLVQAGVLAVIWIRPWRGLELMTLAASGFYFLAWSNRFLAPGREVPAFGAFCVLIAGVVALCLLPPLVQRRGVPITSLVTLAIASIATVVFGHHLLFPAHRELLAVATLALAAIQLAAGMRVLPWGARGRTDAGALTALGIASLATAIPILLEGRPLAPAWAATGCAAVYVGAARRRSEIATGGMVMIALAFLPLLSRPMHETPFTPFVNADFWVGAAPAAALLLAGRFLTAVKDWPRAVGSLTAGAGAWMLAPVLALELYDHFEQGSAPRSYGAIEHAWASSTAIVCVYAAAVAWIARTRDGIARVLVPAGPLAFGVLLGVGIALLAHRHPFTPGLNAVFLAGLSVIAAVVVTGVAAGGMARKVLVRCALAYGLFLLTAELLLWGEHRELVEMTRREARYGAEIAVSVVWTLYAAGLLALGFARRSAELRWAGLVVFLLTVCKVFLLDMATLPAVYRIGSFLVLGVLSIAASFLYQRVRPDDDPGAEPA